MPEINIFAWRQECRVSEGENWNIVYIILMAEWDELGRNTKTYRMFKEFGDAILFQDGLLLRDEL